MKYVSEEQMLQLRRRDGRKIVVCWTFTAAIAVVMLAWGPEALFWNRPPEAFVAAMRSAAESLWLLGIITALSALSDVLSLRAPVASYQLLVAFATLVTVVGLFAGPFSALGVIMLFPHLIPPGDEYMRPAFQFAGWLILPKPGSGFGYGVVLIGFSLYPPPFELVWAIFCASTAALLAVWVWSQTRDETI